MEGARTEAEMEAQLSLFDESIHTMLEARARTALLFENIIKATQAGKSPAEAYATDIKQLQASHQQIRALAVKLDDFGAGITVTDQLKNEINAAVNPVAMETLQQIKRQRTDAVDVAKSSAKFLGSMSSPLTTAIVNSQLTSAPTEMIVDSNAVIDAVRVCNKHTGVTLSQVQVQSTNSSVLIAIVIQISSVLRAVIPVRAADVGRLAGWILDDLVVFGPAEKNKQAHELSDHLVYQRLTVTTSTYFHELKLATSPTEFLPKLIAWLASYRDLFSAPCESCKLLLSYDSQKHKFLPPLHRVFHSQTGKFQPIHSKCHT